MPDGHAAEAPVPVPVVLVHLGLLAGVVMFAHHPVAFLGLFLMFRSAGQLHLGLKGVRTRVPFTGEVAWMQPEGRKPYYMGTVIALTFEIAPGANG